MRWLKHRSAASVWADKIISEAGFHLCLGWCFVINGQGKKEVDGTRGRGQQNSVKRAGRLGGRPARMAVIESGQSTNNKGSLSRPAVWWSSRWE